MLKDAEGVDDLAVPDRHRSRACRRASPARSATARRSRRAASRKKIGRQEADALYQAIQNTKIAPPATDCISPDRRAADPQGPAPGRARRVLRRRHAPAGRVSRQSVSIEVGLAYGGAAATQKVTRRTLTELLGESDARTLRQFLMNTFDGIGSDAADKILTEAKIGTRQTPAKLKPRSAIDSCTRDAEREPRRRPDDAGVALRQPRAAAVPAGRLRDHAVGHRQTNWRSYGLSQSRGNLPQRPGHA